MTSDVGRGLLNTGVTSLNHPLGPVGDGGSAKILLLSPKCDQNLDGVKQIFKSVINILMV